MHLDERKAWFHALRVRDSDAVKLLVLGGTKFLGRAAVEAALAREHEVTLFNRGETNPDLFPEAEKLRGDRDGDLSALEGREWDAVIDPSGFAPRIVRASAELLRGAVGHYVYISSISVYREPYEPGFDESAAVFEDEPTSEKVEEQYAELKAACERVLDEVLPASAAYRWSVNHTVAVDHALELFPLHMTDVGPESDA